MFAQVSSFLRFLRDVFNVQSIHEDDVVVGEIFLDFDVVVIRGKSFQLLAHLDQLFLQRSRRSSVLRARPGASISLTRFVVALRDFRCQSVNLSP